jgi:hypothetical protein
MARPKLLLAEYAFQVDDLLRRFGGQSPDAAWIALGPSAQHRLEALGRPYRIPEDFYEPRELPALCTAVHAKLKGLCEVLDRRFLQDRPDLRAAGVSPFLFHVFPLTMLFDGLESRVFQLDQVLNAHPDREAVLHQTPVDEEGPLLDLSFSDRESVWGRGRSNLWKSLWAGPPRSHGRSRDPSRTPRCGSIPWPKRCAKGNFPKSRVS